MMLLIRRSYGHWSWVVMVCVGLGGVGMIGPGRGHVLALDFLNESPTDNLKQTAALSEVQRLYRLAQEHTVAGRWRSAIEVYRESIGVAEAFDRPDWSAEFSQYISYLYLEQNDVEMAKRTLDQMVRYAERATDQGLEDGAAYQFLATYLYAALHMNYQEWDQVEGKLKIADGFANRIGDQAIAKHSHGLIAKFRAEIEDQNGNVRGSFKQWKLAWENIDYEKNPEFAIAAGIRWVQSLTAQGMLEEARPVIRDAKVIAKQRDNTAAAIWLENQRGMIAFEQNKMAEALSIFTWVARESEEELQWRDAGLAWQMVGALQGNNKEYAQAIKTYRKAIRFFKRVNDHESVVDDQFELITNLILMGNVEGGLREVDGIIKSWKTNSFPTELNQVRFYIAWSELVGLDNRPDDVFKALAPAFKIVVSWLKPLEAATPPLDEALLRKASSFSWVYERLANAHRVAGRNEKAMAIHERMFELLENIYPAKAVIHLQEKVRLLEDRQAWMDAGFYSERVYGMYMRMGDEGMAVVHINQAVSYYNRSDDRHKALSVAKFALASADRLKDSTLQLNAEYQLAWALQHTNSPLEALRHSRKAVEYYAQGASYHGAFHLLFHTALWAKNAKDYEYSLRCYRRAISVSEGQASVLDLAKLYEGLGWVLLNAKRMSEAETAILKSIEYAKQVDAWENLGITLNNIGWYFNLQLGKAEESLDWFEQALESARIANDRVSVMRIRMNMGHAYRMLHQYESAREQFIKARDYAISHGFLDNEKAAVRQLQRLPKPK